MLKHLIFCCVCVCFSQANANEVVWKGKVHSDGTPSDHINLTMHQKYQIKATGFINLGKWMQAGEKLANDPCFEFNEKLAPEKFESLKNSQNIPICTGKYQPDHVYLSDPFEAKQNRIFFWVFDTDYEDNGGAFDVEVIHIK